MSKRVLQIRFSFEGAASALAPIFSGAAAPIAAQPGLVWKIWVMNEAERTAGGVYLFADRASADAYVNGPIIAQLKSLPMVKDVTAQQFDVVDELTAITRGPTR